MSNFKTTATINGNAIKIEEVEYLFNRGTLVSTSQFTGMSIEMLDNNSILNTSKMQPWAANLLENIRHGDGWDLVQGGDGHTNITSLMSALKGADHVRQPIMVDGHELTLHSFVASNGYILFRLLAIDGSWLQSSVGGRI